MEVEEGTADSKTLGVFVQGRAMNVNRNHNPDKPLAKHIPYMTITQPEVFGKLRVLVPRENVPTMKHTNWWTKEDPLGGHEVSKTMLEVTCTIRSTGETMKIPCETGVTVQELAYLFSSKTGVPPEDITFVSKQGCTWRTMTRYDQVRPKMSVNGIQNFKPTRKYYPNPIAIIGAGHLGLKTAMMMLKWKDTNFVVFDRMSCVGGTSWMYQANTTSKLQTEYGAYHLEYDEENPCPTMFNSPWPSRNSLLQHFHSVCEEYGILPYCQLKTNVKAVDMYMADGIRTKKMEPMKWWAIDKYQLTLETVDVAQLHHGKFQPKEVKDEEDRIFSSCGTIFYPGNLTLPREEVYKGEDLFEGEIGYGMFDEVDYSVVPGKNAVIVGHGAFAVENVRTCCEYGAHQCYLVCRRKNIACPRVVSWMANRSLVALPCPEFLNLMKPMYDFLGWDVWSYYAVSANEKRTTCMIQQKARFGIGDIYFLAQYMGKLEVVVEPKGIKRLSKGCVHLEGGRKLEDVTIVLKLLGFVGEIDNDRLFGIKEMYGFWVNDDPRRYLVAEPVSVMASNMGGTSLSPGALSWAKQGIWFFHYPEQYVYGVSAAGMLPRHAADMSDEHSMRPAYVVDARHGTTTGMAVGMHTPQLSEAQNFDGYIKAVKHRLCHPIDKFLTAAQEDWDYYAKKFLAEGFGVDKPYPTYPFTPKSARKDIINHMRMTGEHVLPCDFEDFKMTAEEIHHAIAQNN